MEEILQQYQTLLATVDLWFAGCLKRFPGEIACKGGCSACCRSLFDITLLDACYLKRGFASLDGVTRDRVLERCRTRLGGLKTLWPEFSHPYLLNYRPDEQWEELMPEEDETPCVLLGEDGRCLVYQHRPLSCRLHGIPLLEESGEVMDDAWCTLNFVGCDPLALKGLSAPFTEVFATEVELLRRFTDQLLGERLSEIDTFIPTALLIDFDDPERARWAKGFPRRS